MGGCLSKAVDGLVFGPASLQESHHSSRVSCALAKSEPKRCNHLPSHGGVPLCSAGRFLYLQERHEPPISRVRFALQFAELQGPRGAAPFVEPQRKKHRRPGPPALTAAPNQ